MTPKQSVQLIEDLGKLLKESEGDFLRKSVERLYNMLMDLELEEKIGASKHQRTDLRNNHRNGTRNRPLETAAGVIGLEIPKLRTGSYMPSFVEPRRMTDKALVGVIQEAYINGVSTRKVDSLVESLGISIDKSKVSRLCKEISDIVEEFRNRRLDGKEYPYIWIDATFPKVREGGRVCSMALGIAIAVNSNGEREVLGFNIGSSEDGDFWTEFLKSLVIRGLSGIKLAISDSHPGLKKAINEIFIGATWQRCQVHFMRNVLTQVPKKQKGMVAALVRTVFNQDSKDEAKSCLKMVVDQLRNRFPKAAEVVESAEEDVLAYMHFPEKHWKQIYSSNLIERLNKEIKRRFYVVSVFPDRASVIRLGGAILIEQHDEWCVAERRYLSAESMQDLYLNIALEKSQQKFIAAG